MKVFQYLYSVYQLPSTVQYSTVCISPPFYSTVQYVSASFYSTVQYSIYQLPSTVQSSMYSISSQLQYSPVCITGLDKYSSQLANGEQNFRLASKKCITLNILASGSFVHCLYTIGLLLTCLLQYSIVQYIMYQLPFIVLSAQSFFLILFPDLLI